MQALWFSEVIFQHVCVSVYWAASMAVFPQRSPVHKHFQ